MIWGVALLGGILAMWGLAVALVRGEESAAATPDRGRPYAPERCGRPHSKLAAGPTFPPGPAATRSSWRRVER